MHAINKISHAEALQLLQLSIEAANKVNKSIAVGVCGPEGELLSFLRMDGASPAASLIAQNKAYTASRDRKTTREMGIFMNESNRPPAFWGDMGITGFGGGIPIIQGGQVIGGIGISGLSEEEDERIASEVVKLVFKE